MEKKKELYVITGLSGAGKTLALGIFEDLGYFCIDNLPPLMLKMLPLLMNHPKINASRVALVIDIRARDMLETLKDNLNALVDEGVKSKLIFLEASEEELINRYRKTRRKHPLSNGVVSLREAIEKEGNALAPLREISDLVMDTTSMSPGELKNRITDLLGIKGKKRSALLNISIVSFGYKFGIPLDVDLVFDVRFLPNPFYVKDLERLTGKDEAVALYLEKFDITKKFIDTLFSLVDLVLPEYVREGKSYLTIAVGCTGGRHRAVYIAERLAKHIGELGFECIVRHRDIERSEL